MTSFESSQHQLNSAKLITTGVIVHDATSRQEQADLTTTGVIVHDTPPEPPDSSWLCQIWNSLMHHLLRGHEPQIRQKRNAAGDVYYYGYDPQSGRSAHFTSDTDLRAWLERLPYQ